MKSKIEKRKIRHFRVRDRITGTHNCPRLSVFVSNKHFYAQIIDDDKQHTLVACSSLNIIDASTNDKNVAAQVGKEIARLAQDKQIKKVVFDRGGFLFHGKVKAFADAAKANGLKF